MRKTARTARERSQGEQNACERGKSLPMYAKKVTKTLVAPGKEHRSKVARLRKQGKDQNEERGN